jgi:arylsulfatase A-like enzyme
VTVETAAGQDALEQMLAAAEKSLKKLARRDGSLLWVELGTTLPPWDVPRDFQEPYFQAACDEDDEDEDDETEAVEGTAETSSEEPAPLEPLPSPPLGPADMGDDELYERMQSTYAAAVSYVDAGIGLLREKAGDGTVFLVTSDQGFPLGEHGIIGTAGAAPHDELIHLPLLVCLPGEAHAGRRVARLTQAVDLAPTLAEAFGLHAPDAHGHSLWPLLRGEAEQVRAYAVAGETALCLRTPDWSLQLPAETGRRPQLFVKPEDRSEVNDVAQHHLEWTEYLERLLHEFVAATRHPGGLEAPALRTLEEVNEEAARSRAGGVPSSAG